MNQIPGEMTFRVDSVLQGIGITLASHKLVTVGHLTVLYVEAVQKALAIKPVIEGGVTTFKPSRPIPY